MNIFSGSRWRNRIVLQLLLAELDVDVFGSCVGRRLPGIWTELHKHLSSYKFYLLFENAYHCRDYVTEKVWYNAFKAGLVPVIWGPSREDLEAVLPFGSFILAEEFETTLELVQYLNELDQNDSKYLEYFRWRIYNSLPTDYLFPEKVNPLNIDEKSFGFCQLCRLLQEDDQHEKQFGSRPTHIAPSLVDWWYKNETDTCLRPQSIHEILTSYYYRRLLFNQVKWKSYTYSKYYIFFYSIAILLLCRRLLLHAACLHRFR